MSGKSEIEAWLESGVSTVSLGSLAGLRSEGAELGVMNGLMIEDSDYRGPGWTHE